MHDENNEPIHMPPIQPSGCMTVLAVLGVLFVAYVMFCFILGGLSAL